MMTGGGANDQLKALIEVLVPFSTGGQRGRTRQGWSSPMW
jgi:hypothetical protein